MAIVHSSIFSWRQAMQCTALAALVAVPAMAQEPPVPPSGAFLLWQRPSVVRCLEQHCTETTGPYVPYSRFDRAEDCAVARGDLDTLLRDAGSIAGVTPETVLYTTHLLCLPEPLVPLMPPLGCPVADIVPGAR